MADTDSSDTDSVQSGDDSIVSKDRARRYTLEIFGLLRNIILSYSSSGRDYAKFRQVQRKMAESNYDVLDWDLIFSTIQYGLTTADDRGYPLDSVRELLARIKTDELIARYIFYPRGVSPATKRGDLSALRALYNILMN